MNTATTAKKMRGYYVALGPDHVPTKGSQVYGFCNSHGLRQKNRVKEAAEEEDTSQHEGYRDPGGAGTTAMKDRYGELLHWSQKG